MDLNSQLEEANRTITNQKQRLKEQISTNETQVSLALLFQELRQNPCIPKSL